MAREEQKIRYPDYPLFKGLQKPLEFMGIQGRYIYWAAATAGGAIIGFIAAYCLMGIIAGLIVLVVAITTGARSHHVQATEGTAYQKERPRSVYLCLQQAHIKM